MHVETEMYERIFVTRILGQFIIIINSGGRWGKLSNFSSLWVLQVNILEERLRTFLFGFEAIKQQFN